MENRRQNDLTGDDALNAQADGITDPARRKRLLVIAASLIAILAVVGAYFGYSTARQDDGAAATSGQVDAVLPSVTVQIAAPQSVESVISSNGSIAARREMPVGVVGEGGQVLSVQVEPGQWVKQGQVLAVIDRAVQAQQAEALAASIRVAQADAQLAQSELARAEALISRGFISKADMDRKRATRDAAEARVRVAQAQYREATARNNRLNIVAPAAGLVLTRQVEPGQIVSAGSGILFRIARGGEMELLAQLAEADMQKVQLGARAIVSPVGTDLKVDGHVWQLSPVIDPNTRQGIVRIAVPYHQLLRPGGFADARLTVGSGNAPMLPESAVLSGAQGHYVLIVDDQNIVRRRDVKTGIITDQGVSIASGLNGNEKVVTLAGAFLNVGDKVKPVIGRAGQ